MPSHQLRRSATSPNLSISATISSMIEPQESTPNRDGAISRADRYSRVLPPIPNHPSTPPPPPPPVIPTTPSSSSFSSRLFNSSRPSNLRHVTFAHEASNLSLASSLPSATSSNSSHPSSLPSRKPRFNLSLARQGMHKALSNLRTHTHTLSPKPSLLLRKKSSHSALSGSSPLSDSGNELARPKTAPSSSSSASQFAFASSFPSPFTKDTKKPKDAKIADSKKEMQISAPTGMIKKTPEEIQQMLRDMGVKSGDLPLALGSDSSSGLRFDGDGNEKGNPTSKSETLKNLTTYPQEKDTPSVSTPNLSAIQKGKRPDHTPIPHHPKTLPFARPIRSSSLSSPHADPVQDLTTKPLGWYSSASLDEIRATLPKVKKEDLLSNEEIPRFLEGLVNDFEAIKRVREWRDKGVDDDIERLRKEFLERDDDLEEEDEEEEDEEEEDEEEPYTWPYHNPPDPNFVDGGWAQEEISSAGVGVRWFVFDDVENVLGGPKCPITHAVDGFEEGDGDGEVEREGLNSDRDSNIMFLSPIEEGFGEGEGDEVFDEDAQKISQEEILRREGLL
ncbi:hypothetical protein BOTCAL_0509g00020 [Botryotinia calthae]|uniref:Uncharacterized protein n=1 Tax=Botryotinia calthae TaxID=38488 RepID=A0A4Y8CMX9_9HELO|nr:hypothetical protein BOTCAL_0509g00020 [Botryotinia calthae]